MRAECYVDFLVITALQEECDRLRSHGVFPELNNAEVFKLERGHEYSVFTIQVAGTSGDVKIAVTSARDMGRVAAAVAISDACTWFVPRYIILTGLAMGDPKSYQTGDVIIPISTMDFAIQKITLGNDVQFRTQEHFLSSELREYAQDIVESYLLERWRDSGLFPAPERTPRLIFDCTIACGDWVINNDEFRNNLLEKFSKHKRSVNVIEMESSAISYTLHKMFRRNAPEYVVVKGICDYGGYTKDDTMRWKACYAAGVIVREMVEKAALSLNREFQAFYGAHRRRMAARFLDMLEISQAGIKEVLVDRQRPNFDKYADMMQEGSFFFLGISAKRIVDEPKIRKRLVQLAKNGSDIRFLLLNPRGEWLIPKAIDEGELPAAWNQDITTAVARIKHLEKKNNITISVRVYDEWPIWRMLIFNDKYMHLSYFMKGKQGIESPIFCVDGDHDNSVFYAFLKEFEIMWDKAHEPSF